MSVQPLLSKHRCEKRIYSVNPFTPAERVYNVPTLRAYSSIRSSDQVSLEVDKIESQLGVF